MASTSMRQSSHSSRCRSARQRSSSSSSPSRYACSVPSSMCVISLFIPAIHGFELLQCACDEGSHRSGRHTNRLRHLLVSESFLTHQQELPVTLGELTQRGPHPFPLLGSLRPRVVPRHLIRRPRTVSPQH